MPTGDIFYLLDLITLRGLRLRFSLLAFNARRDFQEPVARKLRFGLEGIFFITCVAPIICDIGIKAVLGNLSAQAQWQCSDGSGPRRASGGEQLRV